MAVRRPLAREFYLRKTDRVAKDLIGTVLCVRTSRGVIRSVIVETEAYLGTQDEACHSFRGKPTARTETMFREGGRAYVYFIYGMHFCLNVVTREAGCPEAVLIRAVEPISGTTAVAATETSEKRAKKAQLETNGPGKLAKFLEIDRKDDGIDLCAPRARIWIEEKLSPLRPVDLVIGKRVGIESKKTAKDLPLRYYLKKSIYVSKRARCEITGEML